MLTLEKDLKSEINVSLNKCKLKLNSKLNLNKMFIDWITLYIKMPLFPKLICRFNAVSIKN